MKKKLIYTIYFCIMLVSISGCMNQNQILTITTGDVAGTYYPVGGAIAQTLTENIENLTVNALGGNASVANCNLIGQGKTDSALVQNNVAYWAYEGTGPFEGNQIKNLRGITSLYPEAIQIIALESSNIKSIEDLKGKRVGIGELGSGVNVDARNILEAYNMSESDFYSDFSSFQEASNKLKNGELDAAFLTAGYPTSSVMDVNIVAKIVLIPIDEEKIETMVASSPYYSKTIIPAGTYTGINTDTITATTMATWVVSSEVKEDVVYAITKALWENRNQVESAHEKGMDITIETALEGMGIPLHPGAQRYYQDIGIIN